MNPAPTTSAVPLSYAGQRRAVRVCLPGREYTITIGARILAELPDCLAALRPFGKVIVVADETVFRLHGGALLGALPEGTRALTFPAGEASKSIEQCADLYRALAEHATTRDSLLIAFGGGVAGDLGGFVAATWMRGIRFIQVPTTLEAAVDASVGGKTGLNLPAGKNLVGAFYQPAAVWIDVELLSTLSQRDFVAGLAESVKHACIREPAFLRWHEEHASHILCRDRQTLAELVARNCAIKAAVVAADEREADLRAILNYGHTLGHAFEHELEFECRHGECVALGMLAENHIAVARLALDRHLAERIARTLAALGLPNRLPRSLSPAAVLAACRLDKKNRAGSIHAVLIHDLGKPVRVVNLLEEEILDAQRALSPEGPVVSRPGRS